MITVNDVINQLISERSLDTSEVGGLSRQIIAQSNVLFSNVLINFESLSSQLVHNDRLHPFLQSSALESLRQVLKSRSGQTMTINSAYRTVAQQHLLYQLHIRDDSLVRRAAKPGFSNHEDGLALDINEWDEWKPSLENNGWQWQGLDDRVHFFFSIGNDEMGKLGVQAFQSLWNKHNPQDLITVDGDFGDQTAARMGQSPANGLTLIGIFRKGDQSSNIRKIRQALVNAGATIPISDLFDDPMKVAVEAFQKKQGLAADGIVGSKTLLQLDVR